VDEGWEAVLGKVADLAATYFTNTNAQAKKARAIASGSVSWRMEDSVAFYVLVGTKLEANVVNCNRLYKCEVTLVRSLAFKVQTMLRSFF